MPIEAEARALIEEVDALGGAARAIERGFFQEAIARSAYEMQKAQESGEMVVVGVNRFTDGSPPPAIEAPDFSALEAQQRARLAESRRRRDQSRVTDALATLRAAAAGTDPAHASHPRSGPRPRHAGGDQRHSCATCGASIGRRDIGPRIAASGRAGVGTGCRTVRFMIHHERHRGTQKDTGKA